VAHICVGERRVAYKVWWRNVSERCHLEDLSINGKVAFRMNFKGIGSEGVDWIDLAQHRGRRRAFVNTTVNLWVQMRAISWLAYDSLATQEGLCSWR
jgi:hypothetical protein